MPKRKTENEVIDLIIKNGYTPVYPINYKNKKTKFTIKDNDGYMFFVNYDGLCDDGGFNKFSKFNPYTLINIKIFLKKNNFKNILLSKQYKDSESKLEFTCANCGNPYEVTFKHLRNDKQITCVECSVEKNASSCRTDIEDVRDIFIKKKLKPLFEKYTNRKERLLCSDYHGYKALISLDSLIGGYKIEVFSKNNPYTIENIKLYLKINNISCSCLSEEYLDAKSNLRFKCSCGEIFTTSFSTLRCQNVIRCKICSKKQSSISLKTEQYLKDIDVKYVCEYRVNDFLNSKQYYFDFLIYINGQMMFIECDGRQHFEPVNFGGISDKEAMNKFQYTVIRDEMKNNYCKDNNIKLIRIPYWEFDNENYKKIINKFIQ